MSSHWPEENEIDPPLTPKHNLHEPIILPRTFLDTMKSCQSYLFSRYRFSSYCFIVRHFMH